MTEQCAARATHHPCKRPGHRIAECARDSAEQVEVHVLLLFLFLHLLLLLLRGRGGVAAATTAASGSGRRAPAAAAELEEVVDLLALAHLGEQRREEGLDGPARRLDQGGQVLLRNLQLRILE